MHTEIQGSLTRRVTDCQNFMQNPFQAERSKEKERLKARLEAWNKVETSGNNPRHLITEILFKPLHFSARANPDVEQVAKMLDNISLLNAG